METIWRPAHPSLVMLLYNNVARLRQFVGGYFAPRDPLSQAGSEMPAALLSAAGAIDLDFQVADLLAQRVAIDAKEIGGADLVAAGCRQCRRQQRSFDLAQDAVIEARRRQAVVKTGKILREEALDRDREIVLGTVGLPRRQQCRL